VCAIAAASAVVLSSLNPAGGTVPAADAASATPACAAVNPAMETRLMRAYRNAGSFRATPSHTLSHVYRQPRRYQHRSWPTRFTITYHPRTRGFTAAFTGIRTR
jgi:hypothetical protein